MLLRAAVVWFAILIAANVNGALRQLLLIPRIGESAGHILSTVLLGLVVLTVAMLSVQWIGIRTTSEAITAGLLWFSLTLAFEFGAGHYLFHKPWNELRADYNIAAGRIWVLIPILTLITPEISRRVRM